LTVGVTGEGVVSVTPVAASVTDAPWLVLVPSDGRVGLAFVQAVETASRARALQILSVFSFMGSYRKVRYETIKHYRPGIKPVELRNARSTAQCVKEMIASSL
jgi:hypothetical protein